MRSALFLFLAPLLSAEQIVIPAVESAVAQLLSRFSQYTSFKGTATVASLPTSRVVKDLTAPEARLAQAVAAPAAANAPSPYWYETIMHQGKAAFNANAKYVVYGLSECKELWGQRVQTTISARHEAHG